jgi:CBS-domain-containing membrane protein
MSAPVIKVSEDRELDEIARLFVTHGIKRVPVVRDGRVTGIVEREDLVRALASTRTALRLQRTDAQLLCAGVPPVPLGRHDNSGGRRAPKFLEWMD